MSMCLCTECADMGTGDLPSKSHSRLRFKISSLEFISLAQFHSPLVMPLPQHCSTLACCGPAPFCFQHKFMKCTWNENSATGRRYVFCSMLKLTDLQRNRTLNFHAIRCCYRTRSYVTIIATRILSRTDEGTSRQRPPSEWIHMELLRRCFWRNLSYESSFPNQFPSTSLLAIKLTAILILSFTHYIFTPQCKYFQFYFSSLRHLSASNDHQVFRLRRNCHTV